MGIAVETCTNLVTTNWVALTSINLPGDSLYFSDPQWASYPGCFYRLRWP